MLAGASVETFLQWSRRPDLRIIAEQRIVSNVSKVASSFHISADGVINLNADALCEKNLRYQAFVVRHALELAILLDGMPAEAPQQYNIRACFAAARTAALFYDLDAVPSGRKETRPGLVSLMSGETIPDRKEIRKLWPELRAPLLMTDDLPLHLSDAELDELVAWLNRSWAFIGPAETLMAAGGDARLLLDPQTGLNHYGCSHRPRPWAVTFASSTASSVSERGFAGAEKARQRLQQAVISDDGKAVLTILAREVRAFLASYFGLPDEDRVVLAPSGTDCELAALAISLLRCGGRGLTNILIAPDETGSGVPLAAGGRHFSADTARRSAVVRGEPINGFGRCGKNDQNSDIDVDYVSIRDADGTAIPPESIARQCRERIVKAISKGRHVLLHQLDLSKTGLLAPGETTLADFASDFEQKVDVVVDACQDRVIPERIENWIARGRAVMITGSKFITGPPFCGALLLPVQWRERLNQGHLPEGLRDYAGRSEWPDCVATRHLPDDANYGLILRWHAAIAEMKALRAVPSSETRACLERFLSAVRVALAGSNDILLLETPSPSRPELPDAWDDIATILCFLVRAPKSASAGVQSSDESFLPIGLEDARRLYRWLNADLSAVFSPEEPEYSSRLVRRLCHIGQPVAMPSAALDGASAGALRISAGARLVSGEPSHEGMNTELRLEREIADAHDVIAKISLIRRHWNRILVVNPLPTYAPHPESNEVEA